MKPPHPSTRASYQSSHRVNWGRFLPWLLLLFIACGVLAAVLEGLFLAGYYLVLLVPLFAALAVAGLARLAVGRGHCRNPWIAGAFGAVVGALLYFGYYYAGMVHDLGPEAARHVEWLPAYIRFRMATQVTRDIHDIRKEDEPRRRRAGDRVFNCLFFAGETGLLLCLPAVGAYRRARKPYCEICQRWMARDLTRFEPAKATELLDALQSGSARSLAALCAAPPFATFPNTTLALDVCPSLKDGTARDCPVFISLKNVTANAGGAGALDPFEVSKGKVLARDIQLTPNELPAFASRFPFLESFVGRSAVAALAPEPAPESSRGTAGPAAEITPVPADCAGRVLTRKSTWIVTASDIAFLLLDRPRRQILFEGDRERWRIPAAALTHCEVEEFVAGQGTAGATRFFLVVLRAAIPGQFWEAPIRERKGTGIVLGSRRKKDAYKLCAAIKEALPSSSPATQTI